MNLWLDRLIKRVLRVIGKSNMIEGLIHFNSHSKADIQSIGLIFEPNFFTAYFYGDLDPKIPLAYRSFDSTVPLQSSEIKALKPVYALTFNGDYTLVPQQVFNDDDAGKYLNFNTSASANEAEWNRIIGLESVLIYKRDEKSEGTVERIFPSLRVKHGIGALLEYCRQSQTGAHEVFLNQSDDVFDLVIFGKSTLLFANSIQAGHPEDVRYFLLYTLKLLGLKTEIKINLLGASAKNEKVIELLKPYLPKLNTTFNSGALSNKISMSNFSDSRLAAVHWAGIYASVCAL